MFNTDEFYDPNGHAVLKFCSIRSLNNYIKLFYEKSTNVVSKTQHDLQITESSKNEILMALARTRRVLRNKSYNVRHVELKRSKYQCHYQDNLLCRG